MNRFLSALITTIIQLPVILLVFLAISIDKIGFVSFLELGNFIIFACMVYFTFFIAYIVKEVNKHRLLSYLLIPASLVVMTLFKSPWEILLFLFFFSMAFMGYYFRKEKFTVYLKNIKTLELEKLDKFYTKKEAKQFIRDLIEEDLDKLFEGSYRASELMTLYLSTKDTTYLINNKEFKVKKYLSKIVPRLVENKKFDRIDGGFRISKEKKVLSLLKELETCEVVDIYQLRDFIEIEYIKDGDRKSLSIKESHYFDPKLGEGNCFTIENKALEESSSRNKYNKQTKSFTQEEYLKDSHPIMNDIFSIVKIFYLVKEEVYKKEEKIVLIYKNKEGFTNSYQLRFNHGELEIKSYKNIFKFFTRVLDDISRTQLEYSYDDKHFHPKTAFDIFDKNSQSLVRKVVGDNKQDFPCTSFGKNIGFKFDRQRGITAYNLSLSSTEYQLINNKQYSYLNLNEKEGLHSFLFIAQLYLNSLFVNKEFDHTLIFDTSDYLEHHKNIEVIEKNLNSSGYIQECYYTNEEVGKQATRFAYIYYDKDKKDKKFLLLKEKDSIDTKYTFKYNDNLSEEINYLTINQS